MLLSLIIQVKHHNPDEFWSSNHWDTFGHTPGYPIKASKHLVSSHLSLSSMWEEVGYVAATDLVGEGNSYVHFHFLPWNHHHQGYRFVNRAAEDCFIFFFSHMRMLNNPFYARLLLEDHKDISSINININKKHHLVKKQQREQKAAWVLQGSCRCRWWLSLEL